MLNKKKIHFYELSFTFIAIVIITLFLNWGYISHSEKTENMMTKSMGSMMSSMHLKNIKLSDLVVSENQKQGSVSSSASHETNMVYKEGIHYITTIIIVVLLPFIIAGTVFLAIIWIK